MAGGAKRETWRDWLPAGVPAPPPEELITRDQLLAALARLGLEVNPHTLRHWEQQGVLPAPVRQRREGATRALYPRWMVDLVWRLPPYRAAGLALADLPDRMRAEARDLAQGGGAWRFIPGHNPLSDFLAERYPELFDAYLALWEEPPAGPIAHPFAPLPIPPALRERLESLVTALAYGAELRGFVAAEAAVVLTAASGAQLAVPIPLRPPPPGGE